MRIYWKFKKIIFSTCMWNASTIILYMSNPRHFQVKYRPIVIDNHKSKYPPVIRCSIFFILISIVSRYNSQSSFNHFCNSFHIHQYSVPILINEDLFLYAKKCASTTIKIWVLLLFYQDIWRLVWTHFQHKILCEKDKYAHVPFCSKKKDT